MRSRQLAVLLVLVLLGCACGVRTQSRPETISLDPSQEASTERPSTPGPATAVVFFIRGKRLQAVDRELPETSANAVLESLAAGPTRTEVLAGTRTAIPPQRFRVTISESSRVAIVQVDEGFASISGENQLLAVAQVVWTLTEWPGIERARLELKGEPLEVPTDRGLVGYSVTRSDFSSVRPSENAPTG